MKKSAFIALFLIFIISFGFAADNAAKLKPYHNENFTARFRVISGEDVLDHGALGNVGFKFGFKNDSSFDIYAGLTGSVQLDRTNNHLENSIDILMAGIPEVGFNLHYGNFRADFIADMAFAGGKVFDRESGSFCLDETVFDAMLNVAADIPVKDKGFFHIYDDNSILYEKSGELDSYVIGDIYAGVGYFVPRDKSDFASSYVLAYDTYNRMSTPDEDAIKNSFKFFATVETLPVLISSNSIDETVIANATYNLAFAPKDNVLTLNLNVGETYGRYYDEEEYDFEVDFGAGIGYMYKNSWGKNALDTFVVKGDLNGNFAVPMNDDFYFDLNANAEVFLPRIIPVELYDNISLGLPMGFKPFCNARFEKDDVKCHFGYSVSLIPFYMELNNGFKFFNMYLDTIKLSGEFTDGYRESKTDSAQNVQRNIYTELEFGFLPTADSDSGASLKTAYEHDFVQKRNYVTIAFDSKF